MKKYIYYIAVSLSIIILTACHVEKKRHLHKVQNTFQITDNQFRINTVECDDIDDWYLDGYRVGKSYSQYKAKIFALRIDYCESSMNKKIDNKYKSSWEAGYKKGKK